jgi:hypothetical protein
MKRLSTLTASLAGATATAFLLAQVSAGMGYQEHDCSDEGCSYHYHYDDKKPCCSCTIDKIENEKRKVFPYYDKKVKRFGKGVPELTKP